MASQFVYGTYKSYKLGTQKILQWLYENALKCGYGAENDSASSDAPVAKKKPKPKPKAKKGKGSKAKGSGKAKSNKACSTATQIKTVRDFTLLAEAIASSKEVRVPLWVTSTIRDVISARRKSARWFSQQAGDTTNADIEESNTGHQHFIGVLEGVLELLGRCEKSGKENPQKVDGDDPSAHMTNLFEVLELEEIESETEQAPVPNIPAPKAPTPEVVYEEEPSAEETAWLIYCFFEDFNIVREHLKDVWTTYKRGGLDLATAALSTNTAFEIFQRAAVELMVELQRITPKDLQSQIVGSEALMFLYTFAALQRGKDSFGKLQPNDQYNMELFDIADFVCLPVYMFLKEFLPVIKSGSVPICTPGYFGKLNLSEDPITPRQKLVQDQVVLLERLLPELVFLARAIDPKTNKPVQISGQDALTKGVLKMISTKQIPLWLVVAVQVQLDIHYVLLEDTSRPFNELSAFTKSTVDSVKSYLEFSKGMKVGAWPKSNDRALEYFVFQCETYVGQDFLDPIRTAEYKSVNRVKQGGSYVLFKRLPVLCGMLLFRTMIIKHCYGIALANAWGSLQSILHLYNATVMEGTLTKLWKDMEAVILANSAERIFIGGRPDKPQEYPRRFLLAMGMSATMWAADKNPQSGIKQSTKGPRKMLASPAIAEIYEKRYIEQEENPGFTLSAIEKLLQESSENANDHQNRNSVIGSGESNQLKRLRASFIIKTYSSNQRGLSQKFSKSHKLTTMQLLEAVERGVGIQAFALLVDYFSLSMRCHELLRIVHREFDHYFKKHISHGDVYVDQESQLPFLTELIFRITESSLKAGEVLYKNKPGEYKSKIMVEAGEILRKFIGDSGDGSLLSRLAARNSGGDSGSEEIEKVKKICCIFKGIAFD